MGTSASRPSKNEQNPLVPSWADPSSPSAPPQPAPDLGRFGPFRRSLGSHASSEPGGNHLKRSLKHYAQQASGGSASANKRFATAHSVGASIYSTFYDAKEGIPLDLGTIEGESIHALIDKFSVFFSPGTGDSDKISTAIYDALSECLDGKSEFNSANLSTSLIEEIFIKYNSNIIFLNIIEDSGKAFENSSTPQEYVKKENELRSLVETVVDLEMESILETYNGRIEAKELIEIQKTTTRKVWDIWSNYND
jgi:hypothetical protein